jgi:hypothetical protein
MKDKILIYQPFGLGDILFTWPLINDIADKNDNDFIWPVDSNFIWIKDYLIHPNITFVRGDKLEVNEFTYIIDLLNANSPGLDCMASKYYSRGYTDNTLWKTLTWKRNIEKENKLYYDVLGLEDNEQYTLLNRTFANPDLKYVSPFEFTTNNKVIEQHYFEGYTLLDWAKVFENAKEIHTVSTSNYWVISCLNVKGELHLYPRIPLEQDFYNLRTIFKNPSKPWILHV